MACASFKYLKGVVYIFVNRLFRQMCTWKGGVCAQPQVPVTPGGRAGRGQGREGSLLCAHRGPAGHSVQFNLPSQFDKQTETINNLQHLSYAMSPYHQTFNCEHHKQ